MQAPSQGFMSQVLAEAAEQETLTEVVSPLLDAAVQALKPPAQPLPLGQPPEDIGERHFGAARALVALFKEKPVTSAFSQRHDFFLPAEAAAPPPQLFFMPPPSPRSGPAVEANTALGAVVQQRVHAVVAGTNFANIHRGMQVQEVEAQFRQLRMPLSNMQMSQVAIFNALLRGGASPRAALLRWICEAAAANDAAGATQPDRSKVSSDGFLLNLGFVLLELSKPFLEEQTKANLIRTDTKFVAAAERHYGAFPDDLQPLSPSAADPAAAAAADGDVNFITQCFFLTWRVLHLGLVSQLARHENLLRHINRIHHQSADPANDLQLSRFMQQQFGTMVSLYQPALLSGAMAFVGTAARWIMRLLGTRANPDSQLPRMPEHFVEDLVALTMHLAIYEPHALEGASSHLTSLFECVVALLSEPQLVHSPHLRAKFAQLLYHVYLAAEHKPDAGRAMKFAQPHQNLLQMHPRAQVDLAQALLKLYGAVEAHLDVYEKPDVRCRIARLLKHLWGSGTEHRNTFQRIAAEQESFVRFANGLMNETNSLVANIMDKLTEIRNVQVLRQDAAKWAAEPNQDDLLARHAENERSVKANLSLGNETIHMLAYLTSDSEIQKPFLLPEILPRLTTTVLSVLTKLVGAKGVNIKVNNAEELDFRPQEMLAELCRTIIHFAPYESFHAAIAADGYYHTSPGLLPKALSTVKKLHILTAAEVEELERVVTSSGAAAEAAAAAEAEDGDVPEDFLDPILCTIMTDPVRLPSGHVMQRATILQHLLNDEHNPFTRAPLKVEELVDADDIKAKIAHWRESRMEVETGLK